MDVNCNRCGEHWDVDYLQHEIDDYLGFVFGINRLVVLRCPSCGKRHKGSRKASQRRAFAEELAQLLGDDLDGFAAEMDELGTLLCNTEEDTDEYEQE